MKLRLKLSVFPQMGVLLGGALLATPAWAHPSLYFDTNEQRVLTERVADTTDRGGYSYAEAFAELRQQADTQKATPYRFEVDIANDGSAGSVRYQYTLSATMPGKHPNNRRYPAWTALARGLQVRMENLAFMYAMTRDGSYLRNAAGTGAVDIALKVSAWAKWTDPDYISCGSATTCLDTVHLLLGVAFVYDVAFYAMNGNEQAQLRIAFREKALRPLAAHVAGLPPTFFNIDALRVMGVAVGASALAKDQPNEVAPWLKLARDRTQSFFDSQGEDGGAFEGHLYGPYATDNLLLGAHALQRQGQAGSLFAHSWLGTLPLFAASSLGTDNRTHANIGDTVAHWIGWVPTMAALAAHGNGRAQWYLELTGRAKPTDMLRFVWARPDLPPLPIAGSGSALFSDVGYGYLRDGYAGAPVVAVKSGPTSLEVGHNHRDQNSILMSAHGEWLLQSSGYRASAGAANTFTVGSIGHNTVLVDKTVSADGLRVTGGQDKLTGGKLEFFWEGPGYAKVVAKAEAAYPAGLLSKFHRRVLYAKPDLTFVLDELAAPSARAYSYLLHPPYRAHAVAGAQRGEMILPGAPGKENARLQAFLVSSVGLEAGYPKAIQHPGLGDLEFGKYAEWRTPRAARAMLTSALVPGKQSDGAPGVAKAVSLGSPALGIAVEGLFGVDAVGSRAPTDPETLPAASSDISAVSSLSSDGWIFSAGLHLDRTFKRAFLQDASYVSIGDKQLVRAARKTSLMLRVERNEAAGCSSLLVERYKDSPDGAPYAVHAAVQEVFLDGKRVPFTVNGGQIVFPSGNQLGSGCRETADTGEEQDAASYRSLSAEGTGRPAIADGSESADDAGAPDAGCSVAARSAPRGAGFFIVLSSAIAALIGRRRRRS